MGRNEFLLANVNHVVITQGLARHIIGVAIVVPKQVIKYRDLKKRFFDMFTSIPYHILWCCLISKNYAGLEI